MFNVTVGNAPVSWGVGSAEAERDDHPDFRQVMDEIAAAGYAGTELGPVGYYPLDAGILRAELASRELKLASSYVPLPLEHRSALGTITGTVGRVGALLRVFGVKELIIAANSTPKRLEIAGSVAADGSDGWSDEEWQQAATALTAAARHARDTFGLRVVFHHHAGTPVETPAEVARLMEMTDPDLVGLCFDTGHYHYGGGDVLDAARTYADRIWYVHLKDLWAEKLERVRRERIQMRRAWEMGVFAELGQGCIDFPAFIDVLRTRNYQGWMIVEQDVVRRPDSQTPWSPLASAKQSRAYLRDALKI